MTGKILLLSRHFPVGQLSIFKDCGGTNDSPHSSLDETEEVYYEEITFAPFDGLGRLEKTGKLSAAHCRKGRTQLGFG
jgi:hypothetical protein